MKAVGVIIISHSLQGCLRVSFLPHCIIIIQQVYKFGCWPWHFWYHHTFPTKALTPKTKANIFWGYILYINHWYHFSSFFILDCIRKNNVYFTFWWKIMRFNLLSSMFCWKVKPFGRTIVNEFRHNTIFFWRLFNTLIF